MLLLLCAYQLLSPAPYYLQLSSLLHLLNDVTIFYATIVLVAGFSFLFVSSYDARSGFCALRHTLPPSLCSSLPPSPLPLLCPSYSFSNLVVLFALLSLWFSHAISPRPVDYTGMQVPDIIHATILLHFLLWLVKQCVLHGRKLSSVVGSILH